MALGWYGKKLTGKKDNRSGEQALIDKLFKEIERVDKDNGDIRKRLDTLEKENKSLNIENYELKKENSILRIENVGLKTELATFRGEIR